MCKFAFKENQIKETLKNSFTKVEKRQRGNSKLRKNRDGLRKGVENDCNRQT